MLYIVYDKQTLYVNKEQARQLELKLNVSSKGREWIDVGDQLFAFHTGDVKEQELIVTEEQFLFLKKLL